MLVVALADELAQRGVVATLHVDVEGRGAARVGQQPSVEDVADAGVAGGEGARGSDRQERHSDERQVEEMPSHCGLLLPSAETKDVLIVPARRQASVQGR